MLQRELSTTQASMASLEGLYKEEQTLRKKYYNQIEDMKGKIRVYARCRPMSQSETERGCAPCVRFLDEFLAGAQDVARAPKTFAYDQVFTPSSTQEQVFEDTKNLLQSALDGYNVCIFAYGQTGSGKTFTMTGSDALPGLSPRAIHHLFRLADECKANHTITFSAFMLELYNDSLVDLLHLVDGGSDKDAPKLEIKKNERGLVVRANSTVKPCTERRAGRCGSLSSANRQAPGRATRYERRKLAQPLGVPLLVENLNHTTRGDRRSAKLQPRGLAGVERAGKTGRDRRAAQGGAGHQQEPERAGRRDQRGCPTTKSSSRIATTSSRSSCRTRWAATPRRSCSSNHLAGRLQPGGDADVAAVRVARQAHHQQRQQKRRKRAGQTSSRHYPPAAQRQDRRRPRGRARLSGNR
ncbi:hypothetical protein PINS_up022074 [Pythium insidiosum]|nr:hypothetical protein PINS_up022074 [Pythium insidiosum]